MTYGNIDYDYAYHYFQPLAHYGCPAIRNGNWFGRDFDWLHNNQVRSVVHTPSALDRYAVLGVSGVIPHIEADNVAEADIIADGVDMFRLLPFYLLDGINEKGLFCTHNVAPLDDLSKPTIVIKAQVKEVDRVCVPMLPRYILDNFANSQQAIDHIIKYTAVYFSDEMIRSGHQSHFLIGDGKRTYVMEFVNGGINIIVAPYITNFNLSGVMFNKDGGIDEPYIAHGVNMYGSGLERYDITTNGYGICGDETGMRRILDKIAYSHSYGEPFWYSEIVRQLDDDGGPITVDTPEGLCTESKRRTIDNRNARGRDGPEVWITCHSSVYDIKSETLSLRNQETNEVYDFTLD